MNSQKSKQRDSNFELLRILSTIFILLHHFYYNNFNFDYSHLTTNQFIVQFLSSFGKVRSKLFCYYNRVLYGKF